MSISSNFFQHLAQRGVLFFIPAKEYSYKARNPCYNG
nr:MAG TPA: hypothetical protein [Caudoviricetes sp.]